MRSVIILLLVIFSLQAFITLRVSVSGYVVDQDGKPLKGVTVTVIGSERVTTTDAKGHFMLPANDNEALALSFSLSGYESKELLAVAAKPVTVKLSKLPPEKPKPAIAESKKEEPAVSKDHHLRVQELYRQRSLGTTGPMTSPQFQVNIDDGHNREGYDHIQENGFRAVTQEPLSTFSIDVDGASYSNVRRFLNNNLLPPAGAVRIEEMINYFQYGYQQPKNNDPFAVHAEMAECPWNNKHKLVLVGLQGRKMPVDDLPPSNLTFLVDVSGSMGSSDKLPLVKQALGMLAEQLREKDMVSIVVYAGAAGVVLAPTNGSDKKTIKEALGQLEAGGSTAGGAGIKLAYQTARQNFVKGGNNRVILCTDGDFNVGMSSDDELVRLIEKERESGVFLTVLGFGSGNYQDAKMQKLADKGNGNHAYIDQISEAKKVFVNEFGGTLFTIAKDVKIQVEFNPAYVQGYRLVGYENRMLNREDFNDDKKDAGELGSGHTVTALYEIIPAGLETDQVKNVDELKYSDIKPSKPVFNNEAMMVKLRYKKPTGDNSMLLLHPVKQKETSWKNTSEQFRFAAAVAEMGMLLRNSEYKGNSSWSGLIAMASSVVGNDQDGYRKEFIQLAEKASRLRQGGHETGRVE
jgi:Ca-activated chloride channel family protein